MLSLLVTDTPIHLDDGKMHAGVRSAEPSAPEVPSPLLLISRTLYPQTVSQRRIYIAIMQILINLSRTSKGEL